MISFIDSKKKVLPYNRKQYIQFLDEDSTLTNGWYALSFQINSAINNVALSIDKIEMFLRKAINALDNGGDFMINHDDKDMKWFLDDDDNLHSLRALFKRYDVRNTFKGYLICKKDDLLAISHDIVSYPYILSYKNLDISHEHLEFIIKITNHLNIDLLSTDKTLLNEVKNKCFDPCFLIKEYRGSQSGIV